MHIAGRVDELRPGDRPALRIGSDLALGAWQESLRRVDEGLDRRVRVDTGRHVDGFARAGHRGHERGSDDADALAHLLMVAVAPKPRNRQARRLERPHGLVKHAWVTRKSELALEVVAVRGTVGFPEQRAGPARQLDALVSGRARVGTHRASIEQGEEVRQLVVLRVVDRVTGHDHDAGPRAGHGAGLEVVDRAHHRGDGVSIEHLVRPLHRQQLAVASVAGHRVDELEARGRLRVGDVEIGEVDQAGDRLGDVEGILVRLSWPFHHRAIPLAQRPARDERPFRGERQATTVAVSSLWTSTGSGRSASRTRVPAGWSDAADVGSWARIVMSPRSTVTRLIAPRNATAITVPTSGPDWPSPLPAIVTASGRTSAIAGPVGTSCCTSGSCVPRTSTPPNFTSAGMRLVRPTKSATKGVAGRE